MRTIILTTLLVVPLLAGCTGTSDGTDGDGDVLAEGKGAISGLLVDDRFRPIHLTDDPTTEFQATGFILLQETGDQVQSNENGEFSFSDLEPGTYTLRATIDKHEATPVTVQVQAGEFAEATLIARRVLSEGGSTITQEYVVFVACSATFVVALNFNECDADQSGESDRSSFETDYRDIDGVTAIVTEMKANQEARYEVDVWWVPENLTEDAEFYANTVFTGDYARMVLKIGEKNTENQDLFTNDVWNNTHPFQTDLLIYGQFAEEGSQVDPFFAGGGVGVQLATEAKFLHTLFIGEPEEDLETYCVLCE